ncbi:hypothetical protein MRB53_002009 [Persea americana]|uniref:Uncharacterized protein n=1 Tax=Persea americana TaxID=3435 RepID=A0ACC2MTD0_PERAE|nr:hypothetical protein MRB53_002009 [Persea americana]
MIVTLKVELEESKRIHERLEAWVVLKTEENKKLDEEVTGLKTQLEKLSQKPNAHQGSSKLNEILCAQRLRHMKFGLGYVGESSSKQVKEAPQKTKQIAVNLTPPKAIPQTQKPKRKLAPPKKMPQQQNFSPPLRIQSTNFSFCVCYIFVLKFYKASAYAIVKLLLVLLFVDAGENCRGVGAPSSECC